MVLAICSALLIFQNSSDHSVTGFWHGVRGKVPPVGGRNQHAIALPKTASIRQNFAAFDLPVCSQNGPWCWDYTTVGVLEYEAAAQLGQKCALSPGYLAWSAQATDSKGSGGSNFGRANRGLENFGAVPLASCGEPVGNSIPSPDSQAVALGQSFGDIELHWIRFWNRKPASTEQLSAMKSDIVAGHPVAVGMQWPNHASFVPGSTLLKTPRKRQVFDGHCVILVGYDDDPAIPGGGSFTFRNSWGEGWGDKGYAKMSYAMLGFCVNDAFSIRKITPKSAVVPETVVQLEASELKVVDATILAPTQQDMSAYGEAWGNKKQLAIGTGNIGDSLSLELPANLKGAFEVRLVITRAENYGQFRVQLPDGRVSSTVEGAGPGVSCSRPISLGIHKLRGGAQKLRFELTGQSSASTGMGMGLIEIQLVSKQNRKPG